jgi:hypothetical protein
MAQPVRSLERRHGRITRWLLHGQRPDIEGPYEKEAKAVHHTHPWWQVMCLTGVDYFSTLGYQPGIAALAAGPLAPLATLVLVLLTLFGARPMYHRVAAESPHGDGSISMLERLLSWWQGKLFVLCLIGFVTTSFVITITLSAADATAHLIENPMTPGWLDHPVLLTLLLIALLGTVFLKGFQEAVGIAVGVVIVYILLSFVVVVAGFYHVALNPSVLTNWQQVLFARYTNTFLIISASLLVFPKLALGLSGFETGVVVMPLVRGDPTDSEAHPEGRIRNTRKLLTGAALIMSVMLIASSLVTTLLIPPQEFQAGGAAYGRALAYLAHTYMGNIFGTLYDISTIAILWFAGASAMAGLLNIVPRYLPRYGMAPDWTRATRPLVLIFTLICFVVTILFQANVEAQGGAYATGVLTLMGSAAVAVTLSTWRRGQRWLAIGFGFITLIFGYTIADNIIERPDGIKIAAFFIVSIIVISLISRAWRSTELRTERVELDEQARQFILDASKGEIRIVANRRQLGDKHEYLLKEQEARTDNLIPAGEHVLFLEVEVCDASEFTDVEEVRGVLIDRYKVLRAESSTVPNAIAALLLTIRDMTGKIPHCYFTWAEGNPVRFLFEYMILGQGDTAPLTREVLRQSEPDVKRRPQIHVGG